MLLITLLPSYLSYTLQASMVILSSLLSAVAAGSAVALQLTSAMPTDHDVARMFKRQSPSEVGSAGACCVVLADSLPDSRLTNTPRCLSSNRLEGPLPSCRHHSQG